MLVMLKLCVGGRNKSQDLSWSYQPLLICAFNPGFMWEPQVVCNNTLPSFVSTQRAFKDNYIVTSFYVCGWRAKSPALWFCCVIQGRSASWFFWAVWWQPSGPVFTGGPQSAVTAPPCTPRHLHDLLPQPAPDGFKNSFEQAERKPFPALGKE